jgi:hypothetical protein
MMPRPHHSAAPVSLDAARTLTALDVAGRKAVRASRRKDRPAVDAIPGLIDDWHDLSPGRPVFVIAEAAARACTGLDEDAMTRVAQRPNPSGCHGHPELLILDFFGHAHDHGCFPVLSVKSFPSRN